MEQTPQPTHKFIIIFISIVSAFLLFANLVVYEALAGVFDITPGVRLFALAFILLFMSAGFILSTILGSYYYNTFTRAYAKVTSVWMGFFTYVFLFSVLYGILLVLFGAQDEWLEFFGGIYVILCVPIAIYGVFHARDVKIKKVGVELKNLPDKWRGRSAVWISDLHLGQLLDETFTKKVVDIVNTLPHDIVFIGGDLYDGTKAPDLDKLIAPLKNLTAPLGTYFITGNHEEFGDSSKFLKAIRDINIHTLIDESVEVDGLQILGVDYHNASNKERFRNILASLKIQHDKPSILLKHEPKDLDVAYEAGISFQISGHTHKAQLCPLDYVGRMIYKEFVYGLQKFQNMPVYTCSGTGTWGPPMRVGTDSEIVVFTFM